MTKKWGKLMEKGREESPTKNDQMKKANSQRNFGLASVSEIRQEIREKNRKVAHGNENELIAVEGIRISVDK